MDRKLINNFKKECTIAFDWESWGTLDNFLTYFWGQEVLGIDTQETLDNYELAHGDLLDNLPKILKQDRNWFINLVSDMTVSFLMDSTSSKNFDKLILEILK